MNAGKTIWTDEKIEQLRRLYVLGKSASQSAVVLGVSRNAVVGKWHRLNFSGRAKPEPARKGPRPAGVRKSPSLAVVPSTREPVEPALPIVVFAPVRDDNRKPRSIVDLAPDGCKWGVDHQDGQHLFCNQPIQSGKPYCAEHFLASISKAVGAFNDDDDELIRDHWDHGRGLHRLVRMLGRQRHAITRQAQYILKLPRAA